MLWSSSPTANSALSPAPALPSGLAMASTWDADLVETAGRMIGGEARAKELGHEGYEELGHKGGQRVRQLIEEGKKSEGGE